MKRTRRLIEYDGGINMDLESRIHKILGDVPTDSGCMLFGPMTRDICVHVGSKDEADRIIAAVAELPGVRARAD